MAKHIWTPGELITARKLNNIEDKIENISSGGDAAGGYSVVENMAELAESTADRVFVLKNDSTFGNYGPCFFRNFGSDMTTCGYLRNDGSRVYPETSNLIPPSNTPIREFLSIVKSWIGRENIIHTTSGADTTGLFAQTCVADSNNKFHMDCSDFVSAVLLGITYNNSRYALGTNESNYPNELLSINTMPQSVFAGKALGGLTTVELAQWFAEQGRLFSTGTNIDRLSKILRPGDILFGCNTERNPGRYFNIEHCALVLGTSEYGDRRFVSLAHCASDTSASHEGTVCHFRRSELLTSGLASYWRMFARPDYRGMDAGGSRIIPKGNGTYTYDCIWMPGVENVLDGNPTNGLKAGHRCSGDLFACTYDYCPVIKGSTIAYSGATKSTDNVNFLVRCHEYDANLNPVKRGQTLAYNGSATSPIVLDSSTRYVVFSIGFAANANRMIRMADIDLFDITITPPNI